MSSPCEAYLPDKSLSNKEYVLKMASNAGSALSTCIAGCAAEDLECIQACSTDNTCLVCLAQFDENSTAAEVRNKCGDGKDDGGGGGLSTGAIIGITVGAIVALLIIILGTYYGIKR